MPEESAQVSTPEDKTSVLDKNVPNPLAKNPNVHTHKVFATVGLILIGVVICLAIMAIFGRELFNTFFEEETTTTKVSTSSATPATSSATNNKLTTYKSEVFKYTIDYPKEFTIKTSSGYYNDDKSQPYGIVRLNSQDSGTKFVKGKDGLIIYETFEGGFCEYSGEGVEKCTTEELMVSGKKVTKYKHPPIQQQTYPEGETYVYSTTHNNNAIVIFTNFEADQYIKSMTFF